MWSDLVIEQTLMRSIKPHGGLARGLGFPGSVPHLWILSLKRTSSVHRAMMDLIDFTEPRRKQDSID